MADLLQQTTLSNSKAESRFFEEKYSKLTMAEPSVYMRRSKAKPKLSFTTVVATPTQADRISALEAQVQALIRENMQLKERLHKVEQAQEAGDQSLRNGVQEVINIKSMLENKKDQAMTQEKIDTKIQAALAED